MMRILVIWVLALLPAGLLAGGIADSIHPIRGVEVRANRMFLKEEAGIRETHIDSAILSQQSSHSLSELLSENTSVFIKNNGRGAMATASFRGTDPSHTQVSWNGLPLNSPMLGMVDFSLIPVHVVDEMSLKHGAASIEDRGGGLGGGILIGNKPRWEEPFHIKFIQGVGSYATLDEFLQFGLGSQKIRSSTRIYYNQSENDYTFVNRGIGNIDPESGEVTNPLDTNAHASYVRYGLLQELYVRPSSNHLLSLVYWGQNAERAIPWPTSYEGPNNANLNSQDHRDHRVVGKWQYYSGLGKLMFRSGLASKSMDYLQLRRVPGLGSVADVSSISQQHSFMNTLSFEREMRHGFSLQAKVEGDLHRVDTRDTVSGLGYQEGRNEWSLFAALQKGFGERLNMNFMLRQGWVDGERIPLIPFFGLDWRILEGRDLVFKANIARNYHQPTLNDLYWQPNGNPDLLPEEGYSVDAGLEWQQTFGEHLLRTGIGYYYSRIRNWIMWIPSFRVNLEPVNIALVESTGLEANLVLSGKRGKFSYRIGGNYALTRSINYGDPLVWGDESYGKQLVYIPLHSGNIMGRFAWDRFHISYQYNAYSERFTTSSNEMSRRDWLYPYFMNDLGAGADFRIKSLDLGVGFKVFNLFNEAYHSVLYRPMPGRNYLLTIKLEI